MYMYINNQWSRDISRSRTVSSVVVVLGKMGGEDFASKLNISGVFVEARCLAGPLGPLGFLGVAGPWQGSWRGRGTLAGASGGSRDIN